MSDDEPSLDDVDLDEVVSEELFQLLFHQTKALDTLIEQQEEIMDFQRDLYETIDASRDPELGEELEDRAPDLPSFY